jgi:hypothetical protein
VSTVHPHEPQHRDEAAHFTPRHHARLITGAARLAGLRLLKALELGTMIRWRR